MANMKQMDHLQALSQDFSITRDPEVPARPPSTMFRLHVPFDPNLVLGILDAITHVSYVKQVNLLS
jgi:hypothetical protein